MEVKELKPGMIVWHNAIRQPLVIAQEGTGPAFTGNEFEDYEISLSAANAEYKNGSLSLIPIKGFHAPDDDLKAENERLKEENEKMRYVIEWLADYVLTAKDGGQAWVAVRDNPDAQDWFKKMQDLQSRGIISIEK